MSSCTVWWAAPRSPAAAPWLTELLDAHERERLVRFRRDADAARYLAAHALSRIVLAPTLDAAPAAILIDRTCRCGEQHGKPTVAGGPQFSLTHSGDLVGVAVHERPVGLDVEQVRSLTDRASLARHACAPGEQVPDDAAFFRMWSRKEAALKATGTGLSTPMSDLTVTGGTVGWTGADAPAEPVWLLDLRAAPGHHGAVAGLGPAPQVRERDGDALLRRP